MEEADYSSEILNKSVEGIANDVPVKDFSYFIALINAVAQVFQYDQGPCHFRLLWGLLHG